MHNNDPSWLSACISSIPEKPEGGGGGVKPPPRLGAGSATFEVSAPTAADCILKWGQFFFVKTMVSEPFWAV